MSAATGYERAAGAGPRGASALTLTIRTKILAGYLVLLAAMAAVGLVAIVGSAEVQRGYAEVQRRVDLARAGDRLLAAAVSTDTAVRGFLIAGEERFLEPLAPARRTNAEAIGKARALSADPDDRAWLDRVESALAELAAVHDTLIARRREGRLANLPAALREEKALMDFIRGLLVAYEAEKDAAVAASRAELLAAHERARAVTGWLLAGAVAFGLYGGTRLARRIARPIVDLAGASRDLEAGQLDRRVTVRGTDEVSALSRAFNAMAARLQERTSQLNATLNELQAPVIPVADRVVALPIVGVVDPFRAQQITELLLAGVVRYRARAAIIDISAIAAVDTAAVKCLTETIQAARLMGVACVLCGIGPELAPQLVALGLTLTDVPTARTLQDAMQGLVGAAPSAGRPA
jgi:CHASE3 domain sensor protein/anti-anti-sigma regulatory factor